MLLRRTAQRTREALLNNKMVLLLLLVSRAWPQLRFQEDRPHQPQEGTPQEGGRFQVQSRAIPLEALRALQLASSSWRSGAGLFGPSDALNPSAVIRSNRDAARSTGVEVQASAVIGE